MFLSSSLSLVDITLLRRDGVRVLLFPGDDIHFRMSCCLSPIVFEFLLELLSSCLMQLLPSARTARKNSMPEQI